MGQQIASQPVRMDLGLVARRRSSTGRSLCRARRLDPGCGMWHVYFDVATASIDKWMPNAYTHPLPKSCVYALSSSPVGRTCGRKVARRVVAYHCSLH